MINKNIKKIEINDKFREALDLLENSNENLFITGKAGTGKSTLLKLFRNQSKKKVVVLAPTGVAALNIKGQTIHSFFNFRPDVTLQSVKKISQASILAKTIKKIDTIIIDEVSMVRADLLDCIEKFLCLNGNNKNKPFGGIQMVFIGDLYQLPPVVTGDERHIFRDHYETPYFFSAFSFHDLDVRLVELEKIYRQNDNIFIELLNSIRNNSVNEKNLAILNSRVKTDFIEKEKQLYIYLTTTNREADEVNSKKLLQIKSSSFISSGVIQGKFEKRSMPTLTELSLKVGAQVMMLNNDSAGRWVNGTIGQIIDMRKEKVFVEEGEVELMSIKVKIDNGKTISVMPHTWELYNFLYDQSAEELRSESVGTFTQYPMKLAWAVTIHKSQGKTFDNVILDIGSGSFAHGQVYVALSRCTSLNGLILKKPILKRHIFMDHKVTKFFTQYKNGKPRDDDFIESFSEGI